MIKVIEAADRFNDYCETVMTVGPREFEYCRRKLAKALNELEEMG